MGAGHPECPERLDAIQERLLMSGLDIGLTAIEAPAASFDDLALAHDADYIDHLRVTSHRLIEDQSATGPAYAHIDPDTAMNSHTLEAALHSVGAAIAATDAVINGELANAFCAVRPPGHHAMRRKAMGFCFFNNVAVAVKHAIHQHGLERVAVVDFDVHHGNGTEDILANDAHVLMVSFFQHPFYPYSGTEKHASNMVNIPVPAYTSGKEVRDLVENYWVPRLEEFKPEMIFISAGFDAHREDDMGEMVALCRA
jgi:acetoin utilization deacetylase AcuC-like enzyme